MPKKADEVDYTEMTDDEAKEVTLKGIFYLHDKNVDFVSDMDKDNTKAILLDVLESAREKELDLSEVISAEEQMHHAVVSGKVSAKMMTNGIASELGKYGNNIDVAMRQLKSSSFNVSRDISGFPALTADNITSTTEIIDPVIGVKVVDSDLEYTKTLMQFEKDKRTILDTNAIDWRNKMLDKKKEFVDTLKTAYAKLVEDLKEKKSVVREALRAALKKKRDRGTLPGGNDPFGG